MKRGKDRLKCLLDMPKIDWFVYNGAYDYE